jgi:hypothetical protein
MCLGVYLSTDTELDLVPWNADARTFNTSHLTDYELPVRRQLTRRYVYHLGAHTQCGCGFMRNGDSEPQEVDASRAALSEFLQRARTQGPCELFVYWAGDPISELTAELHRAPSELVSDEEWIVEGTLTHVSG